MFYKTNLKLLKACQIILIFLTYNYSYCRYYIFLNYEFIYNFFPLYII